MQHNDIIFADDDKDYYVRYLSTHTYIPGGITIQTGVLSGHTFPTIENAFQAIIMSLNGKKNIAIEMKFVTPEMSKSMAFEYTVPLQGICASDILRCLLNIRYSTDHLFRCMITTARERKKTFRYNSLDNIWGCNYNESDEWIGCNKLGNIMSSVGM